MSAYDEQTATVVCGIRVVVCVCVSVSLPVVPAVPCDSPSTSGDAGNNLEYTVYTVITCFCYAHDCTGKPPHVHVHVHVASAPHII